MDEDARQSAFMQLTSCGDSEPCTASHNSSLRHRGTVLARPQGMKITLIAEDGIRLEPLPGPMTIEAESEDQLYSPFHMLGSGLAFCTYSILASWASNAKLHADDIMIEVRWTFVDDPHRIGKIDMTVQWPSLPTGRQQAAQRVAHMCAIHATLMQSPEIATNVVTAEPAPTASV